MKSIIKAIGVVWVVFDVAILVAGTVEAVKEYKELVRQSHRRPHKDNNAEVITEYTIE